jgi:SAM-dependent methyltransferase
MDKETLEPGDAISAADARPFKIAVIGGGPGGLFAARHLAAKAGLTCQIAVYEESDRLGGEIETRQFAGIGPYESGAAEIYDYSRLGPDPLHDLIVNELGLEIKYIRGGPCVLDGKIVLETSDLAELFGERARDEAVSFRKRCADLLSPEAWYFSVPVQDNAHPWFATRADELLKREFTDDVARRYIRTMAHSDVAASPHQTNGLTFLKNVLMDVDGYMDLYWVVGGNEQIVTRLAEELDPRYRTPRALERRRQPYGDSRRRRSRGEAQFHLNATVTAVEQLEDKTYRLDVRVNGHETSVTADYVVVAVPLRALSNIHWRSEFLGFAMERHAGYFDRPGNYLRATFLFRRPFWRDQISTNWWMLDAFDGCCVYDESSRYEYNGYGILAFLIAGNAALELTNYSDEAIEQMCLDALPAGLAYGKDMLLDRRVHRWVATVSAIPGGVPVRPRRLNHYPDPIHAPGLVVVGDYLFDATLNGVMDSAEVASDIILADVVARRSERRRKEGIGVGLPGALNEALGHLGDLMPVQCVTEILAATWGIEPGAKLLHVGSGAGQIVAALRERGFDATGVECNREAILATPTELTNHNLWCDFAHLPFENGQFDAIIETGLYRTAANSVESAIAELYRLTKNGVLLGSATTDLPIELIERFGLLEGVKVLCSRWDWAERFYTAGFAHALFDASRLGKAWEKVELLGVRSSGWYEDSESLLYCVYERASKLVSPSLKKPPTADPNPFDRRAHADRRKDDRRRPTGVYESDLVSAGLSSDVSAYIQTANGSQGQ